MHNMCMGRNIRGSTLLPAYCAGAQQTITVSPDRIGVTQS